MNQWGFVTFIGNSIPEEFLFILMTAFLVGKKNIFKEAGIIKIVLTTVITAIITVLLRKVSEVLPLILILQIPLFIVCYIFLLRLTIIEAILGFMATVIVYGTLEYINLIIITNATGITLDKSYANQVLLVLITIPQRIMQILITFIIYKIPITLINIKALKNVTKGIKKRITILSVFLGIVFIYGALKAKHYLLDLGISQLRAEMSNMIIDMCFIVLLSILAVIITRKAANEINEESNKRFIDLVWFKKLISVHRYDINKIIEILDEMIHRKIQSKIERGE